MAHVHQLMFSCPDTALAVTMTLGESTAITENGYYTMCC